MLESIISVLLAILGGYLAIGSLFGLLFAFLGGANRTDPGAKDGTWGFRLAIIPGCAIFWPYLLLRWAKGTPPPEECSYHRKAAKKGTS
ncbi:MAG: hypothetical protein AAGJ31_04060 [Verrucomicrobiota bacterium]